jgi:putative lipoprotein
MQPFSVILFISSHPFQAQVALRKKNDKKLIRKAIKKIKTSLFIAVVTCLLSIYCEGAFQKVLSKGSKGR